MKTKYVQRLMLFSLIILSFSTLIWAESEKPIVEIGTHIPAFSANDDNGNVWNIENHLGSKYLVVYFYPAAMTGGCTRQACSYRDNSDALKDLDVTVVGISGDSVNNLRIFKEVYELNFTLLSDINGDIARSFGVPLKDGGAITRSVEGVGVSLVRAYTTARWTFVLDKDGNVIYKNTDVKAKDDSNTVIDFLQTLNE